MNIIWMRILIVLKKKLKEIDEKLDYYTHVRHRMKDDLLLMKKMQQNDNIYKKDCVEMIYVLYSDGEKLLTDLARIRKIKEFLYGSPEVQKNIYIIKTRF